MEREQKVRYLKGYYFASREIGQVRRELNAHAYDFGLKSPAITDMPRGSGGGDLSRYIIKAETLMERIESRREKQLQIMSEISDTIDGLEDAEERLILRYRYLVLDHGRLMTWEQIARICHYSRRSVLRIHERALEHLP